MRDPITRVFSHTISSDTFDIRLGQGVCNVASVMLLGVSLRQLTRLNLNEAQLFLGVLLSCCVPLLLVIVGLLLPGARAARSDQQWVPFGIERPPVPVEFVETKEGN